MDLKKQNFGICIHFNVGFPDINGDGDWRTKLDCNGLRVEWEMRKKSVSGVSAFEELQTARKEVRGECQGDTGRWGDAYPQCDSSEG